MPQFAANISMLFTELDFLERFDAAAQAGFKAVEFLFPYEYAPGLLAERLRASGLKNVLFNMPPGDWAGGERGMASIPGREAEFRSGVASALRYAKALGTTSLHAMAGLVPAGGDLATHRATYIANLKYAAAECADQGITLLIEPINTRDMPGYFLNLQAQAHAIREEVGAPNLKVQMDFYHAQIMEGDLTAKLGKYLPHIGHIQIAGVPERHEPDTGEVNYAWLYKVLDEAGYGGWVGCEYRPANGTLAGLGWLKALDAPAVHALHEGCE
jgi:hydroxypyruvate isomerase